MKKRDAKRAIKEAEKAASAIKKNGCSRCHKNLKGPDTAGECSDSCHVGLHALFRGIKRCADSIPNDGNQADLYENIASLCETPADPSVIKGMAEMITAFQTIHSTGYAGNDELMTLAFKNCYKTNMKAYWDIVARPEF